MKRALVALMVLASPATAARTSLGTFDGWGAFKDANPPRCFAISQPVRGGGGKWQPFASVGTWPQARIRGQVHIRLGREKLASAPVTLTIGDRRFQMVAGGADVWAPDSRVDAAIVAMMRSASSMSVSTRAATGAGFAETYALKGAATAMDAAALGCARA